MKTEGLGCVLFVKLCRLAVIGALVLFLAESSAAGEVDKLIDKLVEKGILTRNEADQLVLEMKQEGEEKQKEVKKPEAKVPEWLERTKLTGDLRLRYQYEDREGAESRERGRYRLRLGVESEVVDTVKVAFGVATGSGDPRSTNQTFINSFEKPTGRIDYAYAEWQPIDWFKLTGGKMQNPLFRPSDLLWDTDITPEGASLQFPFKISPTFALFLNSAFFVLDERGSTADPSLSVIQPGLEWAVSDSVSLKLAGTYYGFMDVQGTTLDYSSNSNTLSRKGLVYAYDSYGGSGLLGLKKVIPYVPYAGVFGEYIYNPDPDDNNEGYIGGITVGHEKLAGLWDWQLGYSYRWLEKDAWLDIAPDSDFYGGATGVKGSELIANLGLHKNIWLGLDYYHAEKIDGGQPEDLLQADLYFRF